MIRGKGKKIRLSFCIILFVFIQVSLSAFAEEKKIKVAVLDYPNYITKQEDGSIYGYAYEYLEEIAKYTNWNYDFIEMSLEESNAKLKNGEIDIAVGSQHTTERAENFDYSEQNMGMGGTVLCTAVGNNKYAYNDFLAYEDMKIGALRGSARIEQTQEFFENYGVTVDILIYDTDERVRQALAEGAIDTMLMSMIRCQESYVIVANLSSDPVYFATNKNDPSIKTGIDNAMEKIHIEKPYYEYELMQKYYGNMLSTHAFTAAEREFIVENPIINVGVLLDGPPFAYYDSETGKYKGIILDFYEKIEKKTGFTFQYREYKSRKELQNGWQRDDIDLTSFLTREEGRAKMKTIHFSKPYMETAIVMLYSVKGTGNNKVAAIQNLCIKENSEENSDKELVYYDTTNECMEALRKGEVGATYLNTYEANHYLSMAKYSNLNFRNQVEESEEMTLVLSQKKDKRLYSILEKALDDISEEERKMILHQNTEMQGQYSFSDIIYTNPKGVIGFTFLLGVIIIIFCVLLGMYFLYRRKNAMLLRMNEAKTGFLSRMSHEIRTPLGAIIGMNEIIAENSQEDVIKKCSDKIAISSKHLLQLVNDVLDMNKINEGKVELSEDVFQLQEMLNALEVVYAEAAREKSISFRTETLTPIYPYVYGDELRIKQILINLISNAMKYNRENGEIVLTVKQIYQKEDKQKIFFSIADTGIGIAKENIDIIFDVFEREKRSDVNAVTGSGLGLAISAQIAKLMDSELKVDSELGKGSTFYFTIILKLAKEDTYLDKMDGTRKEQLRFDGKKILVAEDNGINAEIIKRLLESKGAIVTIAVNGEEAVKYFEESKTKEYAAIIMDIRMPVMNGYEATKIIREMERYDAKEMAIIALSANAFAEDKLKSLEVGMNEHLAKPIDKGVFFAALERYVR